MTQTERAPEGPSFRAVWRRRAPSHGSTATTLARELILPLLVFLAPILAFVLIQCSAYGCSLFLGWDSSTYAWWAVQVQAKGPLPMVLQWHYPQLYVLLLSAFGWLLGSVGTAEHALPVLVSLPLGYAYYALTVRLTGDRRLGLFAAFLGGISVDTIMMVANLQRNLLSFGTALLLGEAIHRKLFWGRTGSVRFLAKDLLLWLPLLFVVVASQFETYVVLAIALLVAAALSRKRSTFLRGLLLTSVPVAIVAPLLYGYVLQFTAATSELPAVGLSDAISQAWFFLNGFAVAFVAVGIIILARVGWKADATSRFLVLWLLALAILLVPASLLNVPLSRLLNVIPLPILLAVSVPTIRSWLSRAWRALPVRGHGTAFESPRRLTDPPRPPRLGARRSGALGAALLIVAAPVVVSGVLNDGGMLVPFVTPAEVATLLAAADLARASGYSRAILILYGPSAAYYAPLYRAYFGLHMPDNLAYYGKLQFLFTLPGPAQAYSWKYSPSTEQAYDTAYRNEILTTIGVSGIASWPIVLAGGVTYTAPPSETFLQRFERAPGTYVIPPGALTARDVDTWRLYAYSDCYDCFQGAAVNESWAQASKALGYLGLAPGATFNASYVFSLLLPWSHANLSVGYWDWPSTVTSVSGTPIGLAPFQLYLDGKLVLIHAYGGRGATNLSVPVGPIAPGIHLLNVRAGAPGWGAAILLDTFEFVPID